MPQSSLTLTDSVLSPPTSRPPSRRGRFKLPRQLPILLAALLLGLAMWSVTAADAGWNTPLTLDSAGTVGRYTSLAVVNGNPTISYFDATNYDLKYIYYTPDPEIAVLGNGAEIAAGDATPFLDDHTDFGSVIVGQALTRTFTISNSGAGDLSLTSLSLSGTVAADFTLSGLTTPATVGPNTTATFDVRFIPSVAGTRAATVTITNNDPDENPYDFAIQGTGSNTAPSANVGSDQNVTAGTSVTPPLPTTGSKPAAQL